MYKILKKEILNPTVTACGRGRNQRAGDPHSGGRRFGKPGQGKARRLPPDDPACRSGRQHHAQ